MSGPCPCTYPLAPLDAEALIDLGFSPGNVACFDTDDEYNAFWAGTIELSGIDATGNFTDQSEIDALLAQADIM